MLSKISKLDRVKESVNILKKLKDLGIPETDPGYTGTKKVLDEWIFDGESKTAEVGFPRAGRIAHIFLPSMTNQKISVVLKATEALKAEIHEQVQPDSMD